jgi:hypothetical protein
VDKGADVVEEEKRLHHEISKLLNLLQENYPDSPVGAWWAPKRLGGLAPTIEEAAVQNAAKKAARAASQSKKAAKER